MNEIKFIALLGILLLLIASISAQLIVSPYPLDVEVKINTPKTYQFTLENHFDFKILDFTFIGLQEKGFTFPEIILEPNTSKTIDVEIKTQTSFHGTIESKIEFKYLVNLPDEQETHYINISGTGFDQNYVLVKEGDNVIWRNNDDISHTISSATFSFTIAPNGTSQRIFSQIGDIDFYDPDWIEYYSFFGVIEVVNKSSQEKAHNPNYDLIWNVNLNSYLNPTNISVDNSKENYEVEYGRFKKGLLTIKNIGSETAEVVELTSNSDWIAFNKNKFNIEAGEEEWVEYTVTPVIFETNQTDKTYNLEISVKASNTPEVKKTIGVFVPFKEVISEFGESDIDTMNWLMNVFCPAFPTSILCNQSVMKEGGGNITRGDSDIPINVSAVSWYEMKKDVARIRESGIRSDNQLKLFEEKWGSTIPNLFVLANQSLILQQENEKRQNNRSNTTWILGFFVLMFALFGSIMKLINKTSFKKYLSEGQHFNYRR